MNADGCVRSKVFGKDSKPTVYYMTGYGMTINQISIPARVLSWAGFRVVVFEYDRDVLIGGEPQLLIDAIEVVARIVEDDMKTHQAAGVYGISLGTMFAYNILKFRGIDKAIFSAGGCPLLRAVWDVPHDGPARQQYKTHGYDRPAVKQVWADYDIDAVEGDLDNKHLLLLLSEDDKIIPYDFVRENIKIWQKGSSKPEIVTVRRLSHMATIIRNMFRIWKTAAFYRRRGV